MFRLKKIIFSFILISIIFQLSCAVIPDVKTSDGNYIEIKGECGIGISLKDLSHGKYVLIMKGANGEENEVFGKIVENVIFAKIGEEPVYFSLNRNRILMIYQNKKCIFEKEE